MSAAERCPEQVAIDVVRAMLIGLPIEVGTTDPVVLARVIKALADMVQVFHAAGESGLSLDATVEAAERAAAKSGGGT